MSRRAIAVVFMVLVPLALFAGGSSEPAGDDSGGGSQDYRYVKPDRDVTIEVFSMATNSSGIQFDPLAEYIQDEFGIIVDWLPAAGDTANQRLSAMMAAGELPDVVGFHNTNLAAASDSATAGLLVDLESKLPMLPNVVQNAAKSMEYYADTLGGGTKYFVAQGIGNSILWNDLNWSLSLRWDLYKDIGMPEITSMDALIPILQQMQELEPQTPEGRRVYGMSFWPDWDGATPFMPSEYMAMYGVEIRPGYTEYYPDGTWKSALADDSMYREALEWFYEVNQAGLLDPDSVSQRFDNARSKYEAGRALMGFHSWVTSRYNAVEGHDEALQGFVSLYPSDARILIDQTNPTGTYPYAVSSSTDNEEYALKWLDFYFSTDYASIVYNGFEGENWEMVNGRPELTPLGLERMESGEHSTTYAFYTHPGLDGSFFNEYTGEPISNGYWQSRRGIQTDRQLVLDYLTTLEIEQPIDLLDKDTNLAIRQAYPLVPTLPDDINTIVGRIAPIVRENSWKMVFAEDEAEFNALWEDMQEKAEGLGLAQVLAAGEEALAILAENEAKYGDRTIVNYNK
jgi:putative aldouronate transport system substrate-binding protein